jgi:hypothetical protein
MLQVLQDIVEPSVGLVRADQTYFERIIMNPRRECP